MKHNWKAVWSAVVVAGFAAALHAQTPPAAPNQDKAPAKITLTGCVERADQVASNQPSATTVDSLSFVLIHASKDGAAASRSEAVGTTGTAAAAKADDAMYRLDADVAKLNPHVGHKVEVTGVLDPAAADAPPSSAPSRETAPRVKVEAVKMLAETCAR